MMSYVGLASQALFCDFIAIGKDKFYMEEFLDIIWRAVVHSFFSNIK